MKEAIFFTLIVVCGTLGELSVSRAMKQMGEVRDFRPSAVVRLILRAVRVRWMWAGVGMMALAFFALLGALSMEDVSFVVPVTALSYLVGAAGSALFLKERVSRRRWLGVLLVCLGVALVCLAGG